MSFGFFFIGVTGVLVAVKGEDGTEEDEAEGEREPVVFKVVKSNESSNSKSFDEERDDG